MKYTKKTSIRLDDLELCNNTYLNGKQSDSLEICKWSKREDNSEYKWVIADFRYDEECKCWELQSVCDRLNDDINWQHFGELIKIAYILFNSEDEE